MLPTTMMSAPALAIFEAASGVVTPPPTTGKSENLDLFSFSDDSLEKIPCVSEPALAGRNPGLDSQVQRLEKYSQVTLAYLNPPIVVCRLPIWNRPQCL